MSSSHVELDEEIGTYQVNHLDTSPKSPTSPDQVAICDPLMGCQQDVEIHNILALEREEGIKRIQSEMVSVNQIFRDLASLVTEQGRQIETIESNADESSVNTRQAGQELNKTLRRQDNSVRLWVVILAVLLFVCFLISTHMSAATPTAAA